MVLLVVYLRNIGGITSGIPVEHWWYYQWYTSGILVVLPVVYLRNIGGITSGMPVEYWWYY